MKKIIISVILLFGIILLSGCDGKERQAVEEKNESGVNEEKINTQQDESKQQEIKSESEQETLKQAVEDYGSYIGNWKIKISEDEKLYLLSSLEVYYGMTGINITEINNNEMKGNIYSVKGAPSYRQAEVPFEGEIKDGKVTTSYKDEGWEYTGELQLILKDDKIEAKITRDEVEKPLMWGIPEGKFVFVRPIETVIVDMSEEEKNQLEKFLAPVLKDSIQPFKQGELTDELIINFIGVNLAAGYLDTSEFGDRIKEENGEIQFDESVMNDLANQYFGTEIQEHQSNELIAYEDGTYIVPALGGVSEHPVVQLLLKDVNDEGIYYAIVDYMSEYPEEGLKLEYEDIITLEKTGLYTVKEIKEIQSPIDFEMFKDLL